jgi:PEP-CTERM motif
MNKISGGLVCVALSCFSVLAWADITYTLPTFVGDSKQSTLSGSITVNHTGTLSTSDITGFTFTIGGNFANSISSPSAIVGGNLALIATPTSLSFSYPQNPGGSSLGFSSFFDAVPFGFTLSVTFSSGATFVTPFGDLIQPAQINWGASWNCQGCAVVDQDHVNLGSAGSTVIGVGSPVPEPSSLHLMCLGLSIALGVAVIRARKHASSVRDRGSPQRGLPTDPASRARRGSPRVLPAPWPSCPTLSISTVA